MRLPSSLTFLLAVPMVAAASAACTDRNPAAVVPAPETPPSAQRGILLCSADVRGRTVECRPGSTRTGGASPDLILGTPYVQLASSNVAYDSTSQLFRFDVTVRNELIKPLGTTGTGHSPRGIRVFFHSGPNLIQGTGQVAVANADGVGTFTAANQPYFQYDTILGRGQTSRPKEWRLSLPPSVIRFEFSLYVSAAAPDETGRVEIWDDAPQLLPGGRLPLTATVVTATGATVAGAPVAWSSSDTTVARVDSEGMLTGVSLGQAAITATSGARSGSITATVSRADTYGPTLLSFEVSPDSVDVSAGPATVRVTIQAADGGVGVADTFPVGIQGNGSYLGCTAARVAGTAQRGTWTCSIVVNPWVRNGFYASRTFIPDRLGNRNNVYASLRDVASVSGDELYADLEVRGSTPDTVPPSFTGLAIDPDTVDVEDGPATVLVRVSAADPGSGVDSLRLYLDSNRASATYSCAGTLTAGSSQAGTWTCPVQLPEDAPGGTWRVSTFILYDRADARTTLFESQLTVLGYPTTVIVASPQADETPPTVGTVTLSPDPLDISAGPAPLTVSVALADAHSGVAGVPFLRLNVEQGGFQDCTGATLASGTPQNGIWTCTLQVPRYSAGGTWLVDYIEVVDAKGNTTGKVFSRFSEDTPRLTVIN